MEYDYRKSEAGKRRFENPELYVKTFEFQNLLAKNGIAWHNPFSDECVSDFGCCTGKGNYHTYFPSYLTILKDNFTDLFQQIKHGDQDHQDWLENKLKEYLKQQAD